MLFRDPSQFASRRATLGLTVVCSLMLLLVATVTAANRPDLQVRDAQGTAAEGQPADCDPADCDCDRTECDPSNCDPSDCSSARKVALPATLPDLEFESYDGESVRLSSLEGEVVLIEFWASWCKFCQREVTQMKALYEQLAGQDFRMVGVSLSKTPEDTQEFIEQHEVRWPQMHADGGWKSEAGRAFNVKGVPSRYLIDRNGTVTMLPRGNPEGMVQAILDAIDGKPLLASTR